jgi:hexosaminidase
MPRAVAFLVLSTVGVAVGAPLLCACGPSGDDSVAGLQADGGGARNDAALDATFAESSVDGDGGGTSDVDADGNTDAPIDGSCPPAFPGVDGDASGASPTMGGLVPLPVSVTPAGGVFVLSPGATIRVDPATPEMLALGNYLAAKLRPATGYSLAVVGASGPSHCGGDLILTTTGGDSSLGTEGYDLTVAPTQVKLVAPQPAGLFRGIQTLRQLLPPAIERASVAPGPWIVATGTIHDYPRFAWRGTMLDVARHFFGVSDVETYLELLAYYKINTFHLHLSDDQGWRIVINSWPNLATYGGSTEVDGGVGGFYTQADYSAIVAFAAARYITVVPEIDMPGHTNAALASYANLNCNGVAPPLDTSSAVGVSSLCVSDSETYAFVSDVIREVASLTPGPYFHVGGDEASATSAADYQTFFTQVEPFVQTAGKQMVGWDATGELSSLPSGTIVQFWAPADAQFATDAVGKNAKVLMSPANKAYMDMKYDANSPFGQTWAGYIDEQTAYAWDPAAMVSGITDPQIVGLEAPLWSELLVTLANVEYMAFPRIAGYAEIGWSPMTAPGRTWDEYKVRIGGQGPRLRELGVGYYVSTEIPWQ